METKRRNIISLLIKLVILIFVMVIALMIILEIPAVQRYILNTASHQLIKKTGGQLTFEDAEFNLYSGVRINNALLIDNEQDTLLQIQTLSISPRSTLLSLINKVDFSDLSIKNTKVNIVQRQEERNHNWQRFLKRLATSDSSSSSESVPLFLSHLSLDDVQINYINEISAVQIVTHLAGLQLDVDRLDSVMISLNRLILIEPQIKYQSLTNGRATSTTSLPTSTDTRGPLPKIMINEFGIINGLLQTTDTFNQVKQVNAINTLIKNVDITNEQDWSADIANLSFLNEDLNITHLSTAITSTRSEIVAPNLFVRIDQSFADLSLKITDISDDWSFERSSALVNVNTLKVIPNELTSAVPTIKQLLKRSPLIDEAIQLSGTYRINRDILDFNNMNLWVNGRHHLSAHGTIETGDNILGPMINLKVDQLKSDPIDLDRLIPQINIPKGVKQLGPIAFAGTFDGFLRDFVAQGALDSDLGHVDMDIKFDLGKEDSIAYSGLLALQEFDLATYTGDTSFGLINAELNIEKGSGSDITNSSALLSAMISQLKYRGYTYSDATFDGQLSRKVINGHFQIKDTNLDFQFDGVVDLSRAEPIFDFNVNAHKVDLCALNLSQFPCQVSFDADINFKGSDPESVQGYALLTNARLNKDDQKLTIDKIGLNSRRLDQDKMLFTLQSDFLNTRFEGSFNLLELSKRIPLQLSENHPTHYTSIAKKTTVVDTLSKQNFTYTIETKEEISRLLTFVSIPLSIAASTKVSGEMSEKTNRLSTHITSKEIYYDDIGGQDISIHFISHDSIGNLDLKLDSFKLRGVIAEKMLFNANIKGDELVWVLDSRIDKLSSIDLEARSVAQKKGYFTEFLYDRIIVDSIKWEIAKNPGVGIYPRELDIPSLQLSDGNRSVAVKDINGKGIELSMKDFKIDFINPIIDYDKLYFTGEANVKAKVRDIFEMKDIEGVADIANFSINGDPFGALALRAKRRNNDLLDVDMSIEKDTQQLHVVGTYSQEQNYLDVGLEINNYPMQFFEYIIPDGISETSGLIDIYGDITGFVTDVNAMKMDVIADVRDAGVKIDYIGSYYRIEQADVPISETLIDFSNVILIDEIDNRATMEGGIRHLFLTEIEADATISSDRFIALNTTKEDNPTYYGTGMGALEAVFSGPFDEMDMNVTATAGRQSSLFIPISSTQGGYDQSFIRFDYQKENTDSIANENSLAERLKASGVDFKMNLTFEQEAEVQIIYDEATSNVLIGHGEGDLRIEVTRDGDFTIFGEYNVVNGQYLYTAFNFIAKPFIIDQGGTVTWTGDPINANLDIKARYPGLRAPLNTLLQEYIESSGVPETEFAQRRNVDLTLALTDNLFSPTINFDISFPDLTGSIRTLADTKIQTLKSTENGINNQVFGLMVSQNFLPDNNPLANIGGAGLTAVGSNTLTEFLTSQLSLLASDYLSEQLAGGIISGIDLELALRQNQSLISQGNNQSGFEIVPDEVNLNLRNRFKNDNFILNIGGNYVRENIYGSLNNYLTGDFSFDWYITEDRRLKLRIYATYDYDETNLARRQKYGFGINFRREFGTLSEVSLTSALEQVVDDIKKGNTSSNAPSEN